MWRQGRGGDEMRIWGFSSLRRCGNSYKVSIAFRSTHNLKSHGSISLLFYCGFISSNWRPIFCQCSHSWTFVKTLFMICNWLKTLIFEFLLYPTAGWLVAVAVAGHLEHEYAGKLLAAARCDVYDVCEYYTHIQLQHDHGSHKYRSYRKTDIDILPPIPDPCFSPASGVLMNNLGVLWLQKSVWYLYLQILKHEKSEDVWLVAAVCSENANVADCRLQVPAAAMKNSGWSLSVDYIYSF